MPAMPQWAGALALALLACTNAAGASVRGAADHAHDAMDAAEAATGRSILTSALQDALGQISVREFTEEPSIAVPGEWLADAKKSFVFLPLKVPKDLPLSDVKILTDGRSLLVNIVGRPAVHEEDEATKKFRLVLGAFKDETKGNQKALVGKLKEWQADEDDRKVQLLIRDTLASLGAVAHHSPRSLTIPLNELELGAFRHDIAEAHVQKKAVKHLGNPQGGTATIRLRSTYLQQAVKTKDASDPSGYDFGTSEPNLITIPLNAQFLQKLTTDADYVVPLSDEDAFANTRLDAQKTFIKESFSISLPYATDASRVFAVLQAGKQVVVTVPYEKSDARRNSQAYSRVPLYDMEGKKLEGPESTNLSPETHEQKKLFKGQEHSKPQAPMAEPTKPTPTKKLIPLGDA